MGGYVCPASKQITKRRDGDQLGPDPDPGHKPPDDPEPGSVACELEVDPSGTVVNGGGRGETRASESLLGDALREGVADGRLERVRAKLSDDPQTLCSEADILCIARGSASWTCSSTATG